MVNWNSSRVERHSVVGYIDLVATAVAWLMIGIIIVKFCMLLAVLAAARLTRAAIVLRYNDRKTNAVPPATGNASAVVTSSIQTIRETLVTDRTD